MSMTEVLSRVKQHIADDPDGPNAIEKYAFELQWLAIALDEPVEFIRDAVTP